MRYSLLFLCGFFLVVNATLAQDAGSPTGSGPKPKGQTMDEYMKDGEYPLTQYTEEVFRPGLQPQEETAKEIIEHIRTFSGDPKSVDPEALIEYNRGTTKQKVSDNWMADIYELAGNYKEKSEQFCSQTKMIWFCWQPPDPDTIIPLWEYYVPFQRVESHDVPFTTGYWPEDDVQEQEPLIMGSSGTALITYQAVVDPAAMAMRVADGTIPGVKTMLEESDEALYDGFMPEGLKSALQGIMQAADSGEVLSWKETLPGNWEKVLTEYLKQIEPDFGSIGKGEVDEALIDKLKDKFDRQVSRWRAHKDVLGGFSTAEYHFSTTLFHDITKDYPGFNTLDGGIDAAWSPLTWCHQGANYAMNGMGKAVEPVYFGEWVYQGLFARTYSMVSFLFDGLKEYTPSGMGGGLAPLNCARKNVAPTGDTPQDMTLSEMNQGEENMKWCMAPNHNDAIGPVTKYHKTNYPALASEQAFRRGLLVPAVYPQANGSIHPVADRDGIVPRDKMMIFNSEYDQGDPLVEYVRQRLGNEPKSNHNKEFPRGCQPFDKNSGQRELTADWGGAAYGKANHLNLEYDGHRHVRAHFRYIACCPQGFVPLPGGAPPLQLF